MLFRALLRRSRPERSALPRSDSVGPRAGSGCENGILYGLPLALSIRHLLDLSAKDRRTRLPGPLLSDSTIGRTGPEPSSYVGSPDRNPGNSIPGSPKVKQGPESHHTNEADRPGPRQGLGPTTQAGNRIQRAPFVSVGMFRKLSTFWLFFIMGHKSLPASRFWTRGRRQAGSPAGWMRGGDVLSF